MSELDTQLVNVGLTPNDGTGNNIRDAFIKTNENITAISEFLMLGPKLANLTVNTTITTNSIVANVGEFYSNLHISSTQPSITATTGALTVNGGIGTVGNINVGGTIYGDVEGDAVTASTLGVNGDTILRGNVLTGALSVGTTLDKKNLVVSNDAEIWGQLTVHGDIVTITTSEFKVEYPVIELGRAANVDLADNDGKDRGIEFFWYDTVGATQREGFFGFQNSSQEFTFIPKSNYGGIDDTDIFLGNAGNARFGQVTANIVSTGINTFEALTSNTITAVNGLTGTLQSNSQPNITSLGILNGLDIGGQVSVVGGDVYITGGSLYIDGIPAATSAEAFHGGTVALDTIFISNTASLSSTTGAVRITGGMGVTGNVHVGTQINAPIVSAIDLIGTLTTNAQPNITTIGALGNLEVTGSLSSYSYGGHHVSVATYVNAGTLGGTITTASQPNITTVGTLGNLNVTGNVIANSFTGTFNGAIIGSVSGNITGSAASVRDSDQPAITSVGTLTSLSVSGNITAGNLTVGPGLIQTLGNIQTSGNIIASNVYGQIRTASQPIITSLGSLSSLTVIGTLTQVGNVTLSSGLYTTGAGTQSIGTATNRFGSIYSTSINNSGTITSTNFDGILGATTPAAANFTSVTSNGQIWSTIGGFKFPDGSIQTTAGVAGSGNIAYAATSGLASNIISQANSATITAISANTANTIVLRDASGNFSAGVITATSTNARYADLAEKYQSDRQYKPGTVLVFGGIKDVTMTNVRADVSVAGVVSTAPAYLMNINEVDAVAVALRGKVPVIVIGPVSKGDLLVTSNIPGVAESVGKNGSYGIAVFAKSVEENLDPGEKLINAVII